MNYQRVIDWIDDQIAQRPGKVVLLFLLATVVFTAGLGNVEQESGTNQFTEDLDSQEAANDISREFGGSFGESSDSTTLLQEGGNVLSKPALHRMIRVQNGFTDHDDLRVTSTSSAATVVASELDPNATTMAAKQRAIEQATPGEIDRAVRAAAEDDEFGSTLSDDFNAEDATASAAKTTVSHGADDVPNREQRVEDVVDTTEGDIFVLGSSGDTIVDSVLLTIPAALLLIVVFLIVAFRDPFDLALGIAALLMTLLWTFGFLGLADIPFTMLLVALPPLLIAVGVDFGIHAVNRYREERVDGAEVVPAMRVTTDQLLVAFFIVTGTTVIGFMSNTVSQLGPIRNFGLVAAIGIVFTFLICGIFLPAAKVYLDRVRAGTRIPEFGRAPLGSEESVLGRLLSAGTGIADRAPAIILVVMLVGTAGAGVYASGVDTSFSQEDFRPSEDTPDELQLLPEPFAPPESYQYVSDLNFRDRHFTQDDRVLVRVRGQLDDDHALDSIHTAGNDPPETFARDGRTAKARSIVTVIQSHAEENEAFRQVVAENDRDGDGIPDDNLDDVYDALLSSPARDQARRYIAEDRRSAKIVYTLDGEVEDKDAVTNDAREVADRHEYEATATGGTIIFNEVIGLLMSTIIQSLMISLGGAAVFLMLAYWALDGRPSLGIANVVPIAMTVTFVVATMRFLGVKFNVFNAMILSLTIGLGIDYSVHFTHRFIDELEHKPLMPALRETARGTGGALTGSLLTTASGVGVLVLAVNPAIGVFGLLTALSVLYAYLTTLFVLPSVLAVWYRVGTWYGTISIGTDSPQATPVPSDDD